MAKLGNQQRVLVDEKRGIGFHQLASMESATSGFISLHRWNSWDYTKYVSILEAGEQKIEFCHI